MAASVCALPILSSSSIGNATVNQIANICARRRQCQTIIGDGGNCFSTCLACVLSIDAATVPNFCGDFDEWLPPLNDWLSKRNLFYMDVHLGQDNLILTAWWGYHIISGDGPRGLKHSVVGLRGKMFHDPYAAGFGLVGEPTDWEYGLIIPRYLIDSDYPVEAKEADFIENAVRSLGIPQDQLSKKFKDEQIPVAT